MSAITVTVKQDFLERVAKTNQYKALAEIIWNGFDANSEKVEVKVKKMF